MINQYVPGKEMTKALKTMSADEFIRIFLILLFGLKEAEEFGYTHYDLHSSNVLHRQLPETWAIPITWKNRKYYLLTNAIPVVLDYGLSRIEDKGRVIFPASIDFAKEIGISEEYCPMHDVYKFLYYCLWINQDLFEDLKFLTRFFDNDLNLETLKKYYKETNFIVPSRFRKYRLEDYLDSIIPQLEKFLKQNPGENHVYGNYPTPVNFFTEIGIDLDRFSNLQDSYQYYLLKKMGVDNPEALQKIKKILPRELPNFFKMIDETISYVQKIIPIITRADPMSQIDLLARVGDRIMTIDSEIEVYRVVFKAIRFNDLKVYEKLDQNLSKLQSVMKPLRVIYQQLQRFKEIKSIYPPVLREKKS